jgi:PAS domain S-box-containing protein
METEDLYNRAPCGLHCVAADGTIVRINDTELQWLGYERGQVVGVMHFVDLLTVDSRALLDASTHSLDQHSVEIELELDLLTSDGLSRPCLARAHRQADIAEATGVVRWAVMLLEQRRKAEQLVREGEARFRIMADSAPVALWMCGTNGKCEFFNQSWLTFTGRRMDEEVGDGWAEGVHPLDFQQCIDTYLEAFTARRSFEMEYRLRRADGEYRWIIDHGVPRFTPEGEIAGYIGSCLDITERKRSEWERIQLLERAEAARADAEAAVQQRDQFLVAAAHELKTPLTSLLTAAQILLRFTGDPTQGSELQSSQLEIIQHQTRRLGSLVSRLLDISRLQLGKFAIDPRPVDLAKLVGTIVATTNDGEHELHLRADGPIPASVDALSIEQVVRNLLENAMKFSPGGDPIEVDVSPVDSQSDWSCAITASVSHRRSATGSSTGFTRRMRTSTAPGWDLD